MISESLKSKVYYRTNSDILPVLMCDCENLCFCVLIVLFLQSQPLWIQCSDDGWSASIFCKLLFSKTSQNSLQDFSNSFQLALHLFSSDLAILPFSVKWALYSLPLPQPIKTLKLGFEEPCPCFQKHNSATFIEGDEKCLSLASEQSKDKNKCENHN